MSSPIVLSKEDLQNFKEDGYIIVRNLFSAQELNDIKKQLTELVKLWPNKMPTDVRPMVDMDPTLTKGISKEELAKLPPEQLEMKVRRYFRMCVHDNYFKQLAHHPSMVSICKSIIGEDIKLVQSMAICKAPGSGPKRWHQDNAYFRLKPNDIFGIWAAIDPTDVANGCMHVVRGSHKGGVSKHGIPTGIEIPKEHEHAFFSLLDVPDPSTAIPIPLQPGDALIFHGEVKHFTPPNVTTKTRRAVQFHYANSHCVPAVCDPNIEGDCLVIQYWYYRKAELLINGKEFEGNFI